MLRHIIGLIKLPMLLVLIYSSQAVSQQSVLSPVTPVGEEFMREGVKQRYWGVNVNLQPWNTKNSIDKMAERIKEVGFNAVRLWPNWKTFYNSDVKNSIFPPRQGFDFYDYEKGDGSQIDLFDRMVDRCRENELSIYMTSLMFYPPIYTTNDYVDLVETTPEDRREWIKAVSTERWERGVYDPWWVLHYIDERFQAIWKRHAYLFLNHVNKYTGLRYADDNNIVMWQLHNESKFIDKFMLGNEYRVPTEKSRAFPKYFQEKLKRKYNEYLSRKYGKTQELVKAWGELQEGESLEKMNIDAGAKDASNHPYKDRRIEDFTQFVVGLVKDWNEEFTRYARNQGDGVNGVSVSAIATDTSSWPSPPYYPTIYQGSMVALGSYPDPQKGKADSRWSPKLVQSLAWGPLDFARPYGRPSVIYEINYNRFALYDADLPWLVALISSWQNINGVFFYFWNAPLPDESSSLYGSNVFTSRGKEIWGDEVFSNGIYAAGEAYINRKLPEAEQPIVFIVNEDTLYSSGWGGWNFTGDKTEASIKGQNDYGIATQLHKLLTQTAFDNGVRLRIANNKGFGIDIKGDIDYRSNNFRKEFPGVMWSGNRRELYIDRPKVKAFIGFPTKNMISWGDGFSMYIKNIEELGEGALHEPFVALSISSLDEKNLSESSEIRVTAVSHSYDKSMNYDDKIVKGSGSGEVVNRRVEAEICMPNNDSIDVELLDFAFETIAEFSAEKCFTIPDSLPVFEANVSMN